MATIVTRAGKGSRLTHAEMDANFNNLNTGKLGIGSTPSTDQLVIWDSILSVEGVVNTVASVKNCDNHVDGTTAKIYTAAEKTKLGDTARVLCGHLYTGDLTWYYNPDSLSVADTGVGSVSITHNLGHTNYWVMATPASNSIGTWLTAVGTFKQINTCDFSVKNSSGTLIDSELMFVIYTW